MTRRRPSFRAFARRRWRALGLIAVLLLGALLVLEVTDRGHDPVWAARLPPGESVDQVAISPDGTLVYALVRENGNISRLEARSGSSGAVIWQGPMNATRALLAASDRGVAVATDFPTAFLTIFGKDNTPIMSVDIQGGSPRGLVADGSFVALALRADGNPVLEFRDAAPLRTLHFATFVNSMDLRSGRLAVGTGEGRVVVVDAGGVEVVNRSLAMTVRSLRLDGDATRLVVGGDSLSPANLTGGVALLDFNDPSPVRWLHSTSAGVGLVDIDEGGTLALAVEETLPHTVRAYDAGTGDARWARAMDGIIAHDDAGAHGGFALSPDGRHVALVTLRGPVSSANAVTGDPEWSFGSQGSTVAAFAHAAPDRFVVDGRLTANGPFDAILSFSATTEPFFGRLAELSIVLTLVAIVAAAAVLGLGYWRLRASS